MSSAAAISCSPNSRPANIDGARGARNQIRRIVAMIRERWPNVAIVLRGDSGFARENLMRWCEGNAVDYGFGAWSRDGVIAHCPVG